MKMFKKIAAVLLCVCICALAFAGCGNKGDDSSKKVTLVWALPTSEQTDFAKVSKKINEKLEKLLPNTQLDLKLDASMASKWSLWMAGGEKIDIAHAGFVNDIQTEINAESYTALNDLVDKYAPTLKEQRNGIFKDLYDCGTYKGELYAIPIPQIYVKETLTITIPDDLTQYIDTAAIVDECYKSSTTTEKVYELLDSYLNKTKAAKAIGTDKISDIINPETMFDLAKRGYEFIGGDNSSACYKMSADGAVKIEDFHKTEEFKTFIKWMSKWYKDGYVSKDVLTGGGAGAKCYLIECHKLDRMNEGEDHTYSKLDGSVGINRRYICVTNPENDYRGSAQLGYLKTFIAIPTTCENPVRAIKFIDLLYSEKGAELLNLLNYGIEGEHYQKDSDDEITAFDYQGQASSSAKYGIPNWMTANMFNTYVIKPYTEETKKYAQNYFEKINPSRPKTPLYGFSFDSSDYTVKLSNISLVNQEFELQLTSGVYENYDSVYNTLISKTESAGIKELIADYQKQADKYLSSK